MILSHIAALGKNKVIGSKGSLPWHLPEDLKFFRQKTLGHIIVMGRKTFESFKKPLEDRLHVVVTRKKNYPVSEKIEVFNNIESAFGFCASQSQKWGEEVFIIGGGEIYKQTLDYAHRLYLTLIDDEFDGDTKYPDYEKKFVMIEKRDCSLPYSLLKRKKTKHDLPCLEKKTKKSIICSSSHLSHNEMTREKMKPENKSSNHLSHNKKSFGLKRDHENKNLSYSFCLFVPKKTVPGPIY